MKTDPPATDSRLQRPLRRCRHIPQHATDFSKTKSLRYKTNRHLQPSQVTLYCRLLRTSSISPLDCHAAVPLSESTVHDRAEDRVSLPEAPGHQSNLLDDAGKRGCQADLPPCSSSAGRPAQAGSAEAARPALQVGKPDVVPFPVPRCGRGPL